ncbi:HIRAN domain-containing protein [Vagococcus fluvialis]|uniref:HIRAN domain-containing protein n=1 Tax=Vagococcus fluvialis TaxID=2738 RepID=UPI00288D5052|nr:HIRAN domain-containing protein [Vagococcus fluvialis]MDT2782776.1 HIRAN domain-containing protein [Vagococcus fluvialis]
MYYNGMFYNINNNEDYSKMLAGIEVRKNELSSLESKFWKSSSVKNDIEFIKKDIDGAEKACEDYLKLKLQLEKENLATIYKTNFKINGTSFRKKEVNKAIKFIDEDTPFEKYGGLKNKEIEEYGKTYKYEGFFTTDFHLLPEPMNEFDSNAVKVLINDYHVGYVPKEIASELQPLLINKSINYKTKGMVSIIGGPYKDFDYLEDKVVTIKNDFGFEVNLTLLDTDVLNK